MEKMRAVSVITPLRPGTGRGRFVFLDCRTVKRRKRRAPSRSCHLLLLSVSCILYLLFGGCVRHEARADFVILNGAEPESLDPALVTGQPEMRVVLALFEGLTRLRAPGRVTPAPRH